MLEKIIDWSIANKFMVILATGFVSLMGLIALQNTPLDAIPDLSDVQVIVFTEYPGQAPQVVEDQITYPITTQMLAVPFAKVVRGYSFFGFSFVYIIFEDGTNMYWARSRVLEYMTAIALASTRAVAAPMNTCHFDLPAAARLSTTSWVLSPSSARKMPKNVDAISFRSMAPPHRVLDAGSTPCANLPPSRKHPDSDCLARNSMSPCPSMGGTRACPRRYRRIIRVTV